MQFHCLALLGRRLLVEYPPKQEQVPSASSVCAGGAGGGPASCRVPICGCCREADRGRPEASRHGPPQSAASTAASMGRLPIEDGCERSLLLERADRRGTVALPGCGGSGGCATPAAHCAEWDFGSAAHRGPRRRGAMSQRSVGTVRARAAALGARQAAPRAASGHRQGRGRRARRSQAAGEEVGRSEVSRWEVAGEQAE